MLVVYGLGLCDCVCKLVPLTTLERTKDATSIFISHDREICVLNTSKLRVLEHGNKGWQHSTPMQPQVLISVQRFMKISADYAMRNVFFPDSICEGTHTAIPDVFVRISLVAGPLKQVVTSCPRH